MRLDRCWWVAIAVVAVAVIALVLSQTVFREDSKDCDPVHALLDFNASQAELIKSKHADGDAAVPTVAEDPVYQQWADGLSRQAERVSSPELGPHAMRLANLAAQFAAKLPRMRDEAGSRAPGAPAPAVAYELSSLNDGITSELDQLTKACPG